MCSIEEIWIHIKKLHQEKNAYGDSIITGSIQIVDSPETTKSEQAAALRINNLLYQLNNISYTLLSFLQNNNTSEIINKILQDILQVFKAGRAYIIEYDSGIKTQTCTFEVVDNNIEKEQTLITDLATTDNVWWTEQIMSGHSIVLSTLDDLPEEAASEKEFLALQSIKSLIVVPLVSPQGAWGYVGIDVVEDFHQWSDEDCQWFTSLVNIINICIELQKSRQEAQTERDYLQNLYKHMPLGYLRTRILYDQQQNPVDLLFTDANLAAKKITGKSNFNGLRASSLGLDFSSNLLQLTTLSPNKDYLDDTHFVSRINKYFHFISYMTRPDEVIYLFSDITETFNTHQALDRSEKILRNIYDNLPAGIELYDKNGFLIDLNTKDMEIFGIANKETVLGVNLFENPNLPLHIIEALRRKEAITFRIKYPFAAIKNYYSSKKNGLLEIYTTATELYDSQGNLINYLLINIDNTEITQVYSQLAEFESSFSMVSKFGKIGYCRFDIWTRTGYGIPQWYYNLGEEATTPLSEIIGVYKHVHPEDRDYILKSIQQMKAGVIESFFKDLRITTAEGNKWTRINVIRNTMNDDPQKLDMICVNYDVTELKETEQRLIEAKERAEESDRLKSAFLANMSHEIRTPLNAIVGFSDLLAESDDREERFGYLKIVQENNELLLQLISDILDLSKIEAGTFKFINDRVNVYQLCNEIVRSYSIKIKNHQVKLIFDEQSPVYYITSDKNRVIQVLSNFINNALKFTSQGTITLGYELLPNHELKFYVRDTGQGIAEEKQKVIFDRFVKLNTFVQGTGLGLSICKSLVKQMGGQIGVNSKEGEGSCFWFTHPISLTQNREKTE
ncbi:MAG: ATP-binding protein [Odoribacter splanchnicus]